ncbi:MAG: hypothetical protein AAF492_27580 [Verrucomicrobiota bacterium]
MSTRPDPLETRLSRLRPADPEPDLKDRVLSALEGPKPISFFTSLLRAAAVFVLVAGSVWLFVKKDGTPEAGLQPLYISSEVASRELGEIRHVEDVGWVQTIHYQLIDRTIWAAPDRSRMFASTTPRTHTAFITLEEDPLNESPSSSL